MEIGYESLDATVGIFPTALDVDSSTFHETSTFDGRPLLVEAIEIQKDEVAINEDGISWELMAETWAIASGQQKT
jgi:hypothetical protein